MIGLGRSWFVIESRGGMFDRCGYPIWKLVPSIKGAGVSQHNSVFRVTPPEIGSVAVGLIVLGAPTRLAAGGGARCAQIYGNSSARSTLMDQWIYAIQLTLFQHGTWV